MIDAALPQPVPGRLAGRVAVVTAAASGIGRATALRMGREGARLVAIDLDPGVHDVAATLRDDGREASAITLDCTDRAGIEAAFAGIQAELGRVDILVNGVGRSARDKLGPFAESDPAMWDLVIETSLKSAMLCSRQVVQGMRDRQHGRIVNISSVAWIVPTPFFHDYAAAKAGLVGFTRVLAMEMAPHGVTVNAISPGPILTPALATQPPGFQDRIVATIPMGGYGAPEDIAAGASYLASEDGRFVTGHNLVIGGGRGIA